MRVVIRRKDDTRVSAASNKLISMRIVSSTRIILLKILETQLSVRGLLGTQINVVYLDKIAIKIVNY